MTARLRIEVPNPEQLGRQIDDVTADVERQIEKARRRVATQLRRRARSLLPRQAGIARSSARRRVSPRPPRGPGVAPSVWLGADPVIVTNSRRGEVRALPRGGKGIFVDGRRVPQATMLRGVVPYVHPNRQENVNLPPGVRMRRDVVVAEIGDDVREVFNRLSAEAPRLLDEALDGIEL